MTKSIKQKETEQQFASFHFHESKNNHFLVLIIIDIDFFANYYLFSKYTY